MAERKVVSQEEWREARVQLLEKEKALAKHMDAVAAEQQALPWVKVEKNYVFDGPDGPVPLSDLFGGCSQLIVQHIMFHPDWEAGCPICSF